MRPALLLKPVSTSAKPSRPSRSKTEIALDIPIASTRYTPDATRSGAVILAESPCRSGVATVTRKRVPPVLALGLRSRARSPGRRPLFCICLLQSTVPEPKAGRLASSFRYERVPVRLCAFAAGGCKVCVRRSDLSGKGFSWLW
jgi:hypothetical protein